MILWVNCLSSTGDLLTEELCECATFVGQPQEGSDSHCMVWVLHQGISTYFSDPRKGSPLMSHST